MAALSWAGILLRHLPAWNPQLPPVLSLRKLEKSLNAFCFTPSSFSILSSQSWNKIITLIPAPKNELARLLHHYTTTQPTSPHPHCLFSNTFCFLLHDIENNRFLLYPGVTGLNQLDCTHRVGDPVLPVCPAEHS